jgi:hypothetical protein
MLKLAGDIKERFVGKRSGNWMDNVQTCFHQMCRNILARAMATTRSLPASLRLNQALNSSPECQ